MNRVQIRQYPPRFPLEIDLSFGQETLVLFGPSGAGKSLTLQSIAGLLTPDEGRIVLGGATLFDSASALNVPPQGRGVGYVMQDYALFPHLTVAGNIAFGLYGLPRTEQAARIAEAVALLRLEGLEGRHPRALSGGQQQRVALARALVTRPRLLLLDEPFAALDTPLRARLRRELLALQRRLRLPTILVTHDLAEAHMLADRMAVLDAGRVLQVGPPQELLWRPTSQTVARFTGARNIFVGRVLAGERLRIATRRATLHVLPAPGTVPPAPGSLVECCVRPEAITLVRPGEEARREGRRETLVRGRLVESLNHGLSHTLYFQLDGIGAPPGHVDLEVELSDRAFQLLGVPANAVWSLAIKEEDVHLIGPAIPPFFEGPAPQPPVEPAQLPFN